MLEQTDTYYRMADGRLKRREAPGEPTPPRVRQIGNDIAAFIIGYDDFRVPGLKGVRFCDNPHARFRAIRTRDDATDVIVIESYPWGLWGAAAGYPSHYDCGCSRSASTGRD